MKSRLFQPILWLLFTVCFSVLSLLGDPGSAEARSVAVLPLADVSHGGDGIDGVDLETTMDAGSMLAELGVDVVPHEEVIRFMSERRIRFAGYIDTLLVRQLGEEFDCTHVLVGTVLEPQVSSAITFGITATVYDVNSGLPVWGGTLGSSSEETRGVLGLEDLDAIHALKDVVLFNLLSESVGALDFPVLEAQTPAYQILNFYLSSNYLASGEVVDCLLEIAFLRDPPTDLALQVGKDIFPLQPGQVPGSYRGRLVAGSENGVYEISLLLGRDGGQAAETIPELARYHVLDAPPALELALHKGVATENLTLFRDHLVIIPEMSRRHQMERWMIDIRNENNQQVLAEQHVGNLPDRFIWDGKDLAHRKLADGLYTISLQAWDVVGNEVVRSKKVALQREPASLELQVFFEGDKKFLRIKPVQDVIAPIVSWKLKARHKKGQVLMSQEGETLPSVVQIPDDVGEGLIICDVETRDQLGNRLQLKHTEIEIVKGAADPEQPAFAGAQEPEWVDNF